MKHSPDKPQNVSSSVSGNEMGPDDLESAEEMPLAPRPHQIPRELAASDQDLIEEFGSSYDGPISRQVPVELADPDELAGRSKKKPLEGLHLRADKIFDRLEKDKSSH